MTSNLIPKTFRDNASARAIINAQVRALGKPQNKYNISLQRNTEEYLAEPLADYRDGSDTGEAPSRHNFDE